MLNPPRPPPREPPDRNKAGWKTVGKVEVGGKAKVNEKNPAKPNKTPGKKGTQNKNQRNLKSPRQQTASKTKDSQIPSSSKRKEMSPQ